jgi:hypothetical protein
MVQMCILYDVSPDTEFAADIRLGLISAIASDERYKEPCGWALAAIVALCVVAPPDWLDRMVVSAPEKLDSENALAVAVRDLIHEETPSELADRMANDMARRLWDHSRGKMAPFSQVAYAAFLIRLLMATKKFDPAKSTSEDLEFLSFDQRQNVLDLGLGFSKDNPDDPDDTRLYGKYSLGEVPFMTIEDLSPPPPPRSRPRPLPLPRAPDSKTQVRFTFHAAFNASIIAASALSTKGQWKIGSSGATIALVRDIAPYADVSDPVVGTGHPGLNFVYIVNLLLSGSVFTTGDRNDGPPRKPTQAVTLVVLGPERTEWKQDIMALGPNPGDFASLCGRITKSVAGRPDSAGRHALALARAIKVLGWYRTMTTDALIEPRITCAALLVLLARCGATFEHVGNPEDRSDNSHAGRVLDVDPKNRGTRIDNNIIYNSGNTEAVSGRYALGGTTIEILELTFDDECAIYTFLVPPGIAFSGKMNTQIERLWRVAPSTDTTNVVKCLLAGSGPHYETVEFGAYCKLGVFVNLVFILNTILEDKRPEDRSRTRTRTRTGLRTETGLRTGIRAGPRNSDRAGSRAQRVNVVTDTIADAAKFQRTARRIQPGQLPVQLPAHSLGPHSQSALYDTPQSLLQPSSLLSRFGDGPNKDKRKKKKKKKKNSRKDKSSEADESDTPANTSKRRRTGGKDETGARASPPTDDAPLVAPRSRSSSSSRKKKKGKKKKKSKKDREEHSPHTDDSNKKDDTSKRRRTDKIVQRERHPETDRTSVPLSDLPVTPSPPPGFDPSSPAPLFGIGTIERDTILGDDIALSPGERVSPIDTSFFDDSSIFNKKT